MRRLSIASVLVLGWASSASGQTTLFTCPFQDTMPWTCTVLDGAEAPVDLIPETGHGGPKPCGPGVFWNHERVAPGGDGWNGRGYNKVTYCEADVSKMRGTHTGGYTFSSPSGLDDKWPGVTTFYGRVRLYIPNPIAMEGTIDVIRSLKLFQMHNGPYDGDQRAIFYLERGDVCPGSSASKTVCLSIGRGIFTGNFNGRTLANVHDAARAPMNVGEWAHIQFAWRHGVNGTSGLWLWINNNNEKSPTAADTDLTGRPMLPDGTTTWARDNAGYQGEWHLMKSSSNMELEHDLEIRVMDLEFGGAFDPGWFPKSTGTPPSPQPLRSPD